MINEGSICSVSFRYFSYDFVEIPTIRSRPKNILINETWLEKVTLATPSLCVLIFDWSSVHNLDVDWKNHESIVAVEYQRIRSRFSLNENPSKIILLVILHPDYLGLGGNISEKLQALKKAT